MRKKVLHIIDSFGTGGAETWLLSCVKYLHQHTEANTQFDFLATGGVASVYDDEIMEYGCKIFYQKYSLKSFLSFSRKLRRIIKENQYAAIHNHTDFVSGWHFLAAYGSMPMIRISHVHNPWNFVDNYVTNPFRWFSFKMGRLLMATLTDKITGTSDAVMNEYGYGRWPYKNRRTSPAYCGFNVEKYLYDPNAKKKVCVEFGWDINSHIILFVGRIGLHSYDKAVNQKNPAFAFEIAQYTVQNNKDYHFLFAGFKGVQGMDMEQETLALGLNNQIKFVGLRPDIPILMSAADALLFPSHWEGLGMVAVEAQACGLPILSSSTVPDEAFVIKELVTKKSLSDSKLDWVNALIAIKRIEPCLRFSYNKQIKSSPFSIDLSMHKLLSMYTE